MLVLHSSYFSANCLRCLFLKAVCPLIVEIVPWPAVRLHSGHHGFGFPCLVFRWGCVLLCFFMWMKEKIKKKKEKRENNANKE